ncbi:Hypothetical protein RG1141_PA02260 (plasmid) [Neorhizobium galegae bv. officinalis bv. officinalis str. HAMBI 1141]|uniref:Uncharacterized protein n=1 Tax=Neorhizobium galegae bv. officinalis bv. officinalis str. HAMBI 1141 TaxID=1028801 RepID=A0A068TG47_NEOGA|nr:hypothetical protein [Neorhizobium galegae]MCQ1770879.1 hypothetical protein [Neorhizobium galegae]MCQ1799595.1 hypothetical protein [Neorhizobium galegae]CDN57061.1 Hypothetical protein RG1141_PA02260 [Neorhizobium galegae bv. officinalis bv. officinalis str. HAMBI 1141]CDZ62580.1 Hypothetical protein NGAL_HAMBI2605_20410 [Neorhizobium galegae bv. orientalis]
MEGLKELLLGLAVGAFATYVSWDFADQAKRREAADSQKSYRSACVRDFQNGWSYDKCEHDGILDAKAGLESLQRCTDLVMKANWTMEAFEAACSHDPEQSVGK